MLKIFESPEIKDYLGKLTYLVIIILLGFVGRYFCVGCQEYLSLFNDASLDMNRVALTIYSASLAFCLVSHISLLKRLKNLKEGIHQADFSKITIFNQFFKYGFAISIVLLAFSSVCTNIDYFTVKYLLIGGIYVFSSIFLNVFSYSSIMQYINT